MVAFKKIEEARASQKAHGIAKMTYRVTNSRRIRHDFGLGDPLRRACVSSMTSIAEGFDRRSDNESARYLNIAPGSACAAQSHPCTAIDLGCLRQKPFDQLYSGLDDVGGKIHALAQHVRQGPAG